MNNEYTLYVMDTETTGLSAIKNDVIEISMCRFSMSDLEKRDQKTWLLKALNPETIENEALRVNGHKREDILHFTKYGKETYREPSEVVAEIERWIMEDEMSAIDRVAVGQNILFDIKALQSLWQKVETEDTFPFAVENDNRILDTKQFVMAIDLCTGRRRRYYNLGTLVQSFKVKKRKAHRAEDDVAMTVDLLITMLKPLKSTINQSFQDCYLDLDQ